MHTTSLSQFAEYPTGDRERVWTRSPDTAGSRGAESENQGSAATEMGFWDLVDVVNPLQHLPLINYAYREITGDEISNPARVLGGALYGGPLGLLAGVGQSMLVESTGRDAGEHVVAYLTGSPDDPVTTPSDTVVASLQPTETAGSPPAAEARPDKGTEGAFGVLKLDLGATEGATEAQAPRTGAAAQAPNSVGAAPPSTANGDGSEVAILQPAIGAPIEADSRVDAALAALVSGTGSGTSSVQSAGSPSLLAASGPDSGLLRHQALASYRQSADLTPN